MSISLVAQMIKNLPAMQETQVQSLGLEDQGMATHSSILAWRIPWTEHSDKPQSMGRNESDTTERLTLPLFTTLPQFTTVSACWPFLHVTLTSEVQFLPSWC